VGFAQVFAFKYSRRPGTPASDMDDNVPREVKEERLARAITLQREIMLAKQPTYVGTVQEVLIDGAHNRKRGWMNGRTDSFLPIMIEDSTLEIGDVVQANVTSHQSHWLVGERLA
jgi:tRNA-2-methylthio-N6-dimethylallyladenosine synthase